MSSFELDDDVRSALQLMGGTDDRAINNILRRMVFRQGMKLKDVDAHGNVFVGRRVKRIYYIITEMK